MALLALVAFLYALPTSTVESARTPVLYLIVDSTAVRAEPQRTAKSLAKLERFDVVSGREVVDGWLQIDAATGSRPVAGGWVPLDVNNVIRGDLESLKLRSFHVRDMKWTDDVKLDILRGRVREGFSGTQVQLALGDPVRKSLRAVGSDVAEEWIYSDRRVVFSHSGVRTIELIEDR